MMENKQLIFKKGLLMKPVETASVYPAIASIVEETINLLQGQENPYPYKRWQTLRKNVNINRSAQLMDRAITKASMTTYGKTFSDVDDKSLQSSTCGTKETSSVSASYHKNCLGQRPAWLWKSPREKISFVPDIRHAYRVIYE